VLTAAMSALVLLTAGGGWLLASYVSGRLARVNAGTTGLPGGGPLNILATRGTPSAPELERLGVRRVSVGSGPARAALMLVRRIGQELLATGTYTSFTESSMTYAEANQLFAGFGRS
jgi:2-methylisocitrate lyase-like PEP mutase family enzyme